MNPSLSPDSSPVLSRPEEALDAGGDSTPLYHVPSTGQHGALQENMVNMSGTGQVTAGTAPPPPLSQGQWWRFEGITASSSG